MGTRGQRCFEEANQLGGLVAKMRLASLSQITSTQAATLSDSADTLAKLEGALAKVRLEFGAASALVSSAEASQSLPRPSVAPPGPSNLLRTQLATLRDLFSQRSLFVGDIEATVRRITEAASGTLDIARVSVWFLDEGRTKIVCADLFERSTQQHSTGVELSAADFGTYFEALSSERTIAASDANQDPRTCCFSEVYLKPLGIGAMLDVPIWASEKMVGVICHEHVGGPRDWTEDDETFAYLLSSLVALTLEQRALVRRT